jgi:hypothetical protein
MLQLKQTGQHSLIFGCFDDMQLKGRIILYFDDNSELEDLVNVIVDCGTYFNFNGENFTHPDTIPESAKRLQDPQYKQLIETVMSQNSQYNSYDAGSCFFELCSGSRLPGYVKVNNIITNLNYKRFSSYNRQNKYYVYAFAIDFVRFDIHSKMCDRQLVDWYLDNNQSKGEVVAVLIPDTTGGGEGWYDERLLL